MLGYEIGFLQVGSVEEFSRVTIGQEKMNSDDVGLTCFKNYTPPI